MAVNGHVDDRTWMTHGEPYQMRPQVYRNDRGEFIEVSDWAGDYFRKEWLGRGLAVGDLDRDGRLDAVVSHQRVPSVALQNETATDAASVTLRLVGTASNRNAFCARVEVTDAEVTTMRELIGGGSFQSASAPELHFGLGGRREATVRIRWPSGLVETHAGLTPGHWIAVEGQGLRRLPADPAPPDAAAQVATNR
ncbi:MAG TPA: CRTAC1 family protein, partial [Planctomycetaceae bacterium]